MISSVSSLLGRRGSNADLHEFLFDQVHALRTAHPLVPGVQCAVVHRGRLIIDLAFGIASVTSHRPLTPLHVLQAASNAKPMAAVVAAILADRGVLDLNAPVATLLGGWKANCPGLPDPFLDRITPGMLLSHTSGLGVRGYPQIPWRDPAPPSAPEILDGWFGPEFAIEGEPAPTGEQAIYSGAGFTLLQHVLELATRRPYPDLVNDLIARPLRLRRFWVGRRHDEDIAVATQHDESGRVLPRTFYPALAASGLYTTAADLARFYAGFPGLLSGRTCDDVLRPHAMAENGWKFGLGFALADSNGVRTCKHAGWSTGCWGAAEGLPDRETGIAVLTNSAAGKPIVLELLGAAVQWITTH